MLISIMFDMNIASWHWFIDQHNYQVNMIVFYVYQKDFLIPCLILVIIKFRNTIFFKI